MSLNLKYNVLQIIDILDIYAFYELLNFKKTEQLNASSQNLN